MTLEVSPGFDQFKAAYDAGQPQVVHVKLVDDLETPVSAYLKIGHGRAFAFLFESVEGGTWRGRYSIVAMKPDLVWRCRGDAAEISEGSDLAAGTYKPQAGGALDSLRDLIGRSAIKLPPEVPPMAAGVFGASAGTPLGAGGAGVPVGGRIVGSTRTAGSGLPGSG